MKTEAVETFLTHVVRLRHVVIAFGAMLILVGLFAALQLRKDTSADAFLDPENPALSYRRHIAEVFGLEDPVVIAVRRQGSEGIFNPSTLHLISALTERLASVPNIDADRIVSLATESSIEAGTDGMRVEKLLDLEAGPLTAARIQQLQTALDKMPLYDGVLVSKDRTAALIVAELIDERASTETYESILELTGSLTQYSDNEVFVSGEGAIGGYLSTYIDDDARVLLPVAFVVIGLILFAAFFTARGALVPLAVVLATATLTLGAMALADVSYFAITNGMVVALVGIAVADSVHVFSEYYTQMRLHPESSNASLIIMALRAVWVPIGITSVTTAGGFLSLYFTNDMPPIRYFGLFGAVGVAVAWVYTVTMMPALIAVLPRKQSRFFREVVSRDDVLKRAVLWLGGRVIAWPRTVLALVALALFAGAFGIYQLRMDYERIGNFNVEEPLHQADREINRAFAGTYHLDLVIEAEADEGLLEPGALGRIEALQAHLQSLPHVGATRSIVDYVKQMNRALNEDREEAHAVPEDGALVAQLFLAYQASAEPTALERMLDSAHRTALLRVYLNSGRWSEQRAVVDAVHAYVDQNFAGTDLKATVTGRVAVDDAWMRGIGDGHFASIVASLVAVFFVCAMLFRSVERAALALIPNTLATFCVYAVMGFGDIWLGVATSMFASIAIGVGVDFAIHTLERLREARSISTNIDDNLMHIYHSTGRALIFNTIAVACGFGVALLSTVPPIRLFGALVAAGICAAYLASLTVLPAVLKLMYERRERRAALVPQPARSLAVIALLAMMATAAPEARAETQLAPMATLSAQEVMRRVASRPDGETAERTVRIKLIDRRGTVREQATRAFRKQTEEGRRTVIFYLEPANVRGTAFLTYDYESGEDDQWLYLPALRKVRRVPATQRGDSFLGTDLSYEEVRSDNRVTPSDWKFAAADGVTQETIDGVVACLVVHGTAASPATARELGYSRARWCVDPVSWISRRTEYWDQSGNPLKTIVSRDLQQVQGIWTPGRVEAVNHKTGHKTVLEMSEIAFDKPLADQLFTQQQLTRGL